MSILKINIIEFILKNNFFHIDSIYINYDINVLLEINEQLLFFEEKYNKNKIKIYLNIDDNKKYDNLHKDLFNFNNNIENRQLIIVDSDNNELNIKNNNINLKNKLNYLFFQKKINISNSLFIPIVKKNKYIEKYDIKNLFKNNYKGIVLSFSNFVNKNYFENMLVNIKNYILPDKILIDDALNIINEFSKHEKKYIIDEDYNIISNNNDTSGAFKLKIKNLFNENEDKNENENKYILVDKATDLIYKNIIKRLYFIHIQNKNYIESLNIDEFFIIKYVFPHISIDNIVIDWSEWKIINFKDIYNNIIIKNTISLIETTGKYNEYLGKFIYDIKLFKKVNNNFDIFKNININIYIKNEEYNYNFINNKIQNIFPCTNLKFLNYSLDKDINHIFDLEDSLTYIDKNKGRKNIIQYFNDECFLQNIENKLIWIRINDLYSIESTKDLYEVISNINILSRITGIIIPKVYSKDDVISFLEILKRFEFEIVQKYSFYKPGKIYIQLLIETSSGLNNIEEIATQPGIIALISGLYDYKNSVSSWDMFNQFPELLYQKENIINICNKYNIISIDSITPVLDYEYSFKESLLAYNINFINKWSVHPIHIKSCTDSCNLDLYINNIINKYNNKLPIKSNIIFLLKNLINLQKYITNEKINYIIELINNIDYDNIDNNLNNNLNIIKLYELKEHIKIININNKNTKDIIFRDYYNNNNIIMYDLDKLKDKYNNNEPILKSKIIDKRDLLDNINCIMVEIEIKDIINIINCNNFNLINKIIFICNSIDDILEINKYIKYFDNIKICLKIV